MTTFVEIPSGYALISKAATTRVPDESVNYVKHKASKFGRS